LLDRDHLLARSVQQQPLNVAVANSRHQARQPAARTQIQPLSRTRQCVCHRPTLQHVSLVDRAEVTSGDKVVLAVL